MTIDEQGGTRGQDPLEEALDHLVSAERARPLPDAGRFLGRLRDRLAAERSPEPQAGAKPDPEPAARSRKEPDREEIEVVFLGPDGTPEELEPEPARRRPGWLRRVAAVLILGVACYGAYAGLRWVFSEGEPRISAKELEVAIIEDFHLLNEIQDLDPQDLEEIDLEALELIEHWELLNELSELPDELLENS